MTDVDRPEIDALASALAEALTDRDRWRQIAHDRSRALLDALKQTEAAKASA